MDSVKLAAVGRKNGRARARALGAWVNERFANRTHCPNGHPLMGDNLRLQKICGGKYVAHVCRACERDSRKARARKAAQ